MLQDLRYAWRSLRRTPGFTIAALLTLAIGIGANAAMLSVVNAVLLRKLPYPTADRMVVITQYARRGAGSLGEGTDEGVSYPNFLDYQRRQRTFERIRLYRFWLSSITDAGNPEAVLSVKVSADFLQLTGTPPALGRDVSASDDQPGGPKVVIVSDRIWRQRLGARPDALNGSLQVDGEAYTVIGVMPAGWQFPGVIPSGATIDLRDVEIMLPNQEQPAEAARGNQNFFALGMLKPGISTSQAAEDLERIARELETEYPNHNKGQGASVRSLQEVTVAHIRPTLLVLLGAIGLVLLVACANVANLILARGRSREREIAVRSALGASPGRLTRQLLTENALLALSGGGLGLAVAWVAIRGMVWLRPENLPQAASLRLDAVTVAGALLLSLVTAILVGLAPVIRFTRLSGRSALGEGPRTAGSSPGMTRARQVLTVAQVAVSLALLVGAGLLGRSFLRLQRVELGFDPGGVMTVGTMLPPGRYPSPSAVVSFWQRVIERLKDDPEVSAVAAVNVLPMSGFGNSGSFAILGRAPFEPGEAPDAAVRYITPDYFLVLGIRVIAGRAFVETDDSASTPVVIISESIARKFFPAGDALGKQLRYYGASRDIVGVVGDILELGPTQLPPLMLYSPMTQMPNESGFVAVKSRLAPGVAAERIRQAVLAVDNQQALINVRTMSSYFESSISQQRFMLALMGVFAIVALALAVIGLYGVIAYMVAQRTREIGIRVALGATGASIVRLVLGQGLLLAGIGVVVGLIGALALSRALTGLLYGVSAQDPMVYAGVSLLLLLVAAAASALPARRAAAVDPVTALRME
jgi:putative ABC transport system permease protein